MTLRAGIGAVERVADFRRQRRQHRGERDGDGIRRRGRSRGAAPGCGVDGECGSRGNWLRRARIGATGVAGIASAARRGAGARGGWLSGLLDCRRGSATRTGSAFGICRLRAS